jgi:hypothetical protein
MAAMSGFESKTHLGHVAQSFRILPKSDVPLTHVKIRNGWKADGRAVGESMSFESPTNRLLPCNLRVAWTLHETCRNLATASPLDLARHLALETDIDVPTAEIARQKTPDRFA